MSDPRTTPRPGDSLREPRNLANRIGRLVQDQVTVVAVDGERTSERSSSVKRVHYRHAWAPHRLFSCSIEQWSRMTEAWETVSGGGS